MNEFNPDDYVLPSSADESLRLEMQGAQLYGGLSFLDPFLRDEPQRVLEIGCGTGLFSRYVASHLENSQVVGIDMDKGRLDFARAQHELNNLAFTKGDLHQIPFDQDQFDLVFCRFVLVHTIDPAKAIKEMARTVKPGGRIVAYEMVHDGIWFSPEKRAFSKVLEQVLEVMRNRDMEPSQGLHLATSMIQAGLSDVRAEVIPHSCLASEPIFEKYRQNWIDTLHGLRETLDLLIDKSVIHKAFEELHAKRPDDFLLELTVLATATKT